MANIVIKNVSETKKDKLVNLVKQQGYSNLSEFFRKVIDEVVTQNNVDFLMNDNVLQNLINLNGSIKLLTDVSNKNVETVSEVKQLLIEILNEVN
ncbi:hypothetical protein AAHB45_09035 [Pediococcus pentosaceus]|uniref:hypothetical protein n=1 Tax=Pediococcus pentosaceus TaxID=1255 RepID=UPI0031649846